MIIPSIGPSSRYGSSKTAHRENIPKGNRAKQKVVNPKNIETPFLHTVFYVLLYLGLCYNYPGQDFSMMTAHQEDIPLGNRAKLIVME